MKNQCASRQPRSTFLSIAVSPDHDSIDQEENNQTTGRVPHRPSDCHHRRKGTPPSTLTTPYSSSSSSSSFNVRRDKKNHTRNITLSAPFPSPSHHHSPTPPPHPHPPPHPIHFSSLHPSHPIPAQPPPLHHSTPRCKIIFPENNFDLDSTLGLVGTHTGLMGGVEHGQDAGQGDQAVACAEQIPGALGRDAVSGPV